MTHTFLIWLIYLLGASDFIVFIIEFSQVLLLKKLTWVAMQISMLIVGLFTKV